jgi:hypothetical protein
MKNTKNEEVEECQHTGITMDSELKLTARINQVF